MSIYSGPEIVNPGLILNLDAGNPNSYPGTTGFPGQVEYLIVAGGGGGGGGASSGLRSGGGGGGGGVLTGFINVTPQSYAIVVALGGGGGAADNPGSAGQNSLAFGLIALGGGGGGGINSGATTGGSGGGGSGQIETPAAGTTGQGTTGGSGISTTPFSGGGGGGSNTAGQGPLGNGAGGNGISSSITGTAVFYAGGGGGGNSVTGGGRSGQGSTGNGGGLGGSLGSAGTAAAANTGGGGGGGGGQISTAFAGGAGGSGIVIVRYPGAQQATGGTVVTAGGYTTHTFTTSGVFAPLTWSDVSGNGQSATLINGPSYNSSNDGSIVFDGVDDYVQTTAVVLPTANNAPFTLEAFCLTTSTTSYQTVLGTAGTFSQIGFLGTTFTAGRNGGGGNNLLSSLASVSTNTWYQLCMTYDGTTASFYLNGSFLSSGNIGSNGASNGVTVLGTYTAGSAQERLTGRVAIARVYNRAITAAEVNQNFQALRGRFGI